MLREHLDRDGAAICASARVAMYGKPRGAVRATSSVPAAAAVARRSSGDR
jgi:hypothetical protein